jgi:hypothetical protein
VVDFSSDLLADGCELRPHQLQNLVWALRQEDVSPFLGGGVPGLNGSFWSHRAWADGDGGYYYFELGKIN